MLVETGRIKSQKGETQLHQTDLMRRPDVEANLCQNLNQPKPRLINCPRTFLLNTKVKGVK